MKLGRFFVTSVILFGIAATVACHSPRHRDEVAKGDTKTADASGSADAQAAEAKMTLEQAKTIQQELASKYRLFIASEPKILRSNRVLKSRDFVNGFDWKSVRLSARHEIQANLEQFVQLVTKLLDIDKKADREQLGTWLDSGQGFLQSLLNFEKTYGANYDPVKDGEREPGPLGSKKSRDGIEI